MHILKFYGALRDSMFCMYSIGILSFYVVYKVTNIYNPWVVGEPDQARYKKTKSGGFDSTTFIHWVKTIIIHLLRRVDGKSDSRDLEQLPPTTTTSVDNFGNTPVTDTVFETVGSVTATNNGDKVIVTSEQIQIKT